MHNKVSKCGASKHADDAPKTVTLRRTGPLARAGVTVAHAFWPSPASMFQFG
ncbi:hypothetical protein QFZ89_005148 [Paraburkholderia youngii]